MVNRCVNLDWLEIYCIESEPLSWTYFQEQGFEVSPRAYGTPMYREMFTISRDGFQWLEVRRDPYSPRSLGGIFDDGACHIRLCNRTCYTIDPVGDLREFLIKYKYEYRGITRVDICVDFLTFDRGDKPQGIINDFMLGKLSKINQCNVSAHGRDMWDGRYWNSLKWGSESSMVTTKLYNKTMELNRPGHEKFYIRDTWEAAHLCSRQLCTYDYRNKDGSVCQRYGFRYVPYGTAIAKPVPQNSVKEVQVWRVEFAIHANARHWINMENGQYHRLELSTIDNRLKLLFLFHALASRFFHFKRLVYTREGNLQRKDRCPDKVLFVTSREEQAYRPKALAKVKPTPSWFTRIMDDLRKLYYSPHVSSLVSSSAMCILRELWEDSRLWSDVKPKAENVYNLDAMSRAELVRLYRIIREKIEPIQTSF